MPDPLPIPRLGYTQTKLVITGLSSKAHKIYLLITEEDQVKVQVSVLCWVWPREMRQLWDRAAVRWPEIFSGEKDG